MQQYIEQSIALVCIQVDDTAFMNTNWSKCNKWRGIYSTNCSSLNITCAPAFTVCQDNINGACSVALLPPMPIQVGPSFTDRNVTYTGVNINGGGNAAVVAPGSSVSLSYSVVANFNINNVYCPGCIYQGYIGIGGTFQTLQCEPSINVGYSNTYQGGNFVAPSTPGVYYLTYDYTLDYTCQPRFFSNNPANAIGVLVVGPPFPVVVGGSGPVTVTNDAPSCFPLGQITVTWTATDTANNTASCTQDVTVTPATVYYRDRDNDGFGNASHVAYSCSQPAGFILNNTDCNDDNSNITNSGCTASALNFDGVNDYAFVPGVVTNSFTIETWIKADASQSAFVWESAVSASDPSLEGSTENLQFWVNDNTNVSTGPLVLGTWNHIACTFDEQTNLQSIFVNGLFVDSITAIGAGIITSGLFVGSRAGSLGFYPGSMDEMRIWTRALTAQEISDHYACEIQTPQNGLALNYHFNQGIASANNSSDSILIDASGNGINGDLNNFALNGPTSNWVSPGGVVSGNACPLPCIVNIPDTAFKNALLADTLINTNQDGEIQCAEAAAYTGTINIANLGISDLTGIEAFVNLTNLDCSNNLLTSFDISNNIALTSLYCSGNQLGNN
ncbi:MAG: HYR domain-containing protein [Bacteroidetes bacterium]|nr:HYR domain-containing protein [Bacteroidota bacterium]